MHRKATHVDALELNEIRLMIEPEAAYYAALRASDNELKRIAYYNTLVEAKVKENADRRTEEIRFHLSIARAVHNNFMDELMPIIFDAIDVTKNIFNYESIRQGTLSDHSLIVRCLQERDADAARTAMRLHMLRGIYTLKEEQDR